MSNKIEPLIFLEEGDASLVLDSRHFPVVIARPVGAFTESFVDHYYLKWRNPLAERASAEGKEIVVIFDFSQGKSPPATIRKRAGDYSKNDPQVKGLSTTVIVVNNPLLRGVITAMIWMAGSDNVKTAFAANIEDALTRGLNELSGAGHDLPDIDPKTYTCPSSQ